MLQNHILRSIFMKTKALISLITAVCICGCTTGCGNADNESKIVTQSSKISNDKTEVEKSGNEENQNNDSAAENESDSETKIADEVLNADMYSDVFQVGEKVIKLPMTAKELFDMDGVELADDANDGITQGDDPSTVIAESNIYDVIIDDVKTSFFFTKTKDEKQLLSDCNVLSIEEIKNVVFPKGVKVGMPIEDVRKLWGEPDLEDVDTFFYIKDMVTDAYIEPKGNNDILDSSITSYQKELEEGVYSRTGYYYSVKIDLKTKTVSNIWINSEYLNSAKHYIGSFEDIPKPEEIKSFSSCSWDQMSDYSFDINYELPAYMNYEKCAYVYEVNGQRYAIHKLGGSAKELDLTEYTDDNLKNLCEKEIRDLSLFGHIDSKLFTYTIKKDGNRAVIILRDNTKHDYKNESERGSYSLINVHCMDENFVDTKFSFAVAPCDGKESISDEELESADSWFFEFAQSVKTTKSDNIPKNNDIN